LSSTLCVYPHTGVDSSNDTTRITKTNKFGRKLSVTLLTQSLNHFRDSNVKLRRWYDRKSEYINKKGKIRMALCKREAFNILNPYRNISDVK